MPPRAARRFRAGAALLTAALCLLSWSRCGMADAGPAGGLDELLERIRHAPRQADGFADLATWLFRRGELTRAVAAAEEASRLAPDSARHQRLLGYLLAANGDEARAQAAFERAAAIDPSARASLADFHLARAWREYQKALRSGTPNPALEERLRAVAAAAEIGPELKGLMNAAPPDDSGPAPEVVPPIYLAPEVKHALVVEKSTQTVRLYANRDGSAVLVQTYPCTTGQVSGVKEKRGDRRTPDGVYVVTDLLPGSRLPDLYGSVAMPLSYPNAWDRRMRRGGYGIWLHGSDRLASPFTPRDTQGCVLMRNEDLIDLAGQIEPGVTPILIAEDVPYQRIADWQAALQSLRSDVPAAGVLAVAAMPEYAVLFRRDGGEVVRDFAQKGKRWRVMASEHAAGLTPEDWQAKLAGIRPADTADLVRVEVLDRGDSPQIVIETTGPVQPRAFRPELGNQLYLDLPGVRSQPLPMVVSGSGDLVTRVRVAATDYDPPSARLVIDLQQPMEYRIESDGGRTVVSLLSERAR